LILSTAIQGAGRVAGTTRQGRRAAVAAADGTGSPLALDDPGITAASAVHDAMATLSDVLLN